MADGKGDIIQNTLPSQPQSQGGGGEREEEKEGKGREGERREGEEEETYVLQFAAIKLCKFAVIRENLSIFAVIKKKVAVITPLGDFDMRPKNTSFLHMVLHSTQPSSNNY